MERRLALLLACVLLSAPSRAGERLARPSPPAGDGEVYVFLQPLPPEAERVAVTLGTVSAVNDLGAEIPLELSLPAIRQPEVRRQRLLASGRVPAGSYSGLSIRIQRASLPVPDAGVRVDAPFVVPRGGAPVLWLTFAPGGSAAGDAGFSPAFTARLAPRPLSSRAGFVSNARSNSITVFDKRLRQVAAVVPTPGDPAGMALDQRSGRLYVACPREDEVEVIDVAAVEVIERTRVAPGDGPSEVALTPNGRTLVAVNTGSNSVSFFDAAPLTRLERVNVGSGPGSVVIDPTGRRAFVFNALSSSISVLDIASRSLVATISVESAPLRGEFSGRGDRLFVIHERSPYATIVDPLQLGIITRARLRMAARSVKVDARRGLVYVGGRDDPMVEFYDPNTLMPVGSIKTPGSVSHLAIDAEDNSLYMVIPETGRLVIGSLADRRVVSEIDVGGGPYWVVVMGEK